MTGHQGRDHHGCVTKDVVDHVQYIGTYSCCAQSIRAHTVCRAHDHRSSKCKCVRNGRHQDAVCILDPEVGASRVSMSLDDFVDAMQKAGYKIPGNEYKAIKQLAPFENILLVTGENPAKAGTPYLANRLP